MSLIRSSIILTAILIFGCASSNKLVTKEYLNYRLDIQRYEFKHEIGKLDSSELDCLKRGRKYLYEIVTGEK